MLRREKIFESLLELSGRAAPRSRAELLGTVLRNTLLLAECDGAVALTTSGRRVERSVLRHGMNVPDPLPVSDPDSEFMRNLLKAGHPVACSDLAADGRAGPHDACPGVHAGPALFVPLRVRDHSSGCLTAYRRSGSRTFTSEDTHLVVLLAAWAAMALENLRLSENMEKLAVTDELTQVYNYRFLKTALRREMKRAQRFGQQLSLIMIDVDNLKAYNDCHGHLRGSFLLKEIASLFASQVRSWDLVAKYGGDEFTLILPQTEREGALVVAERLRAVVSGHTFPLADPGSVTVSLGVATFPDDADAAGSLIEAADRALYLAKQRGRNRVETRLRAAA
jgi:diguanylate cyclase (GGDEF)-like protein